jgi:hypothetical protein
MVERISEIYSLLVPLLDGRLIIPRSCVAEVVGFQNLRKCRARRRGTSACSPGAAGRFR